MTDNRDLYQSSGVVGEYSRRDFLSKPERTILEMIAPASSGSKMLDLGVGTGRTTKYFAPVFGTYIGLDNSVAMIAACRSRFQQMANTQFTEGDVRNMQQFESQSFDFVLFSFNGIDCIGANERPGVLNEIRRILRPGGRFVFSSHNIYNVDRLYSFQLPRNPIKYISEYRRMKKVRMMNPAAAHILNLDIAELIDGDIDFKARYVYIKPQAQIKQLKEAGFDGIRVFSLKNGRELTGETEWTVVDDAWLYYLCTA
jgi:ubiquinone/menaquinone biosynthesis C-methylase UbiE